MSDARRFFSRASRASDSALAGFHGTTGDLLTFAQRSWNARATTLAGASLGWLSVPVVALLPVPQGKATILAIMVATNVTLTLAHILTRVGRGSLGVVLLVLAAFAQHIALIREPFASHVVPYFASVPVLIGAACLPRRAIPVVVTMGVVALGLEWWMASAAGAPVDALQRTFAPASVLLALTAIVTWLAVASLERGYELARAHEQQQKLLVAELEERTRLAALGQLTAGIAHDFNNFLLVIQASVDLAEQAMDPAHPARVELAQIRAAALGAARLSEELLGFSRKREAPVTEVVPSALLRDIAPLLARLAGTRARLRVEREDGRAVVLASTTQIEQVLFNLVSNARDASALGGEIVVRYRTRSRVPRDGETLPPGDYAELSVQDRGAGISEEVKRHLFEPFFTTKAIGSGTGLGLSTCQAIAAELGGAITVDSEPGQGATFALLLPVYRSAAGPVPPSAAAPPNVDGAQLSA